MVGKSISVLKFCTILQSNRRSQPQEVGSLVEKQRRYAMGGRGRGRGRQGVGAAARRGCGEGRPSPSGGARGGGGAAAAGARVCGSGAPHGVRRPPLSAYAHARASGRSLCPVFVEWVCGSPGGRRLTHGWPRHGDKTRPSPPRLLGYPTHRRYVRTAPSIFRGCAHRVCVSCDPHSWSARA